LPAVVYSLQFTAALTGPLSQWGLGALFFKLTLVNAAFVASLGGVANLYMFSAGVLWVEGFHPDNVAVISRNLQSVIFFITPVFSHQTGLSA
jgi:hypothetical protein